MKTEAKKAFHHGFKLTEAELRRIFDCLVAQMERIPGCQDPSASFEVKFRNGSVSQPSTLDEILDLENFGSGSIQRLKIDMRPSGMGEKYAIGLEFTNLHAERDGPNGSIRYRISGDDRHWVFTASSELEERIVKIKVFNAERFGGSPGVRGLLPMLALCVVWFGIVWGSISKIPAHQLSALNAIEAAWKSGELSDIAELILDVERVRLQTPGLKQILQRAVLSYGAFGILVLIVLPYYLSPFLSYFLPPYVFYWGEYTAVYDKRRNWAKFVGVTVFLALALSVLGNYITSLFAIRH